ncbi:MAG TPA: glycosyltransferase family 1 protein [Solirubrobacteraceae bacterium]|jgi:glycosyltransferase involved in cell wall biosynthesis|nr:glycosyltransferase family 1 protein [Solirubrobacteraceae bacterium]
MSVIETASPDQEPTPSRGRPLRVGLNLMFLGERSGGSGRYARELPGALLAAEPSTEVHIFVSRNAPVDLREEPWAQEVRWVRCPTGLESDRARLTSQFTVLPLLAAARRLDILHSLANFGPAIVPGGVSSVISLLDVIWLRSPQAWGGSERWQRSLRRIVEHDMRHADRVFAISRAGAKDITRLLAVPAERIDVTPLGVRAPTVVATSERIVREELALGQARVVLCIAQKLPYKNLHRLVRALPALEDDVVLVLPGFPTPHERELRALAEELGVAERVRLPDWLSESSLAGLYGLSSAFVLPSLIEGFGLPVLEAMLRGVPVACSNTSSLPEVAGDAALLFDPESQEEVNSAIRRLLDDRALAAELVARGRERAASFTWERTGAATLEGYRRAIASRSARQRLLSTRR